MKRLTALAQLVAMYADCKGITSSAKIAEATGYSERAIWKAKAELRDSEAQRALNHSSVNHSSVQGEPECSPLARAQAIPKKNTPLPPTEPAEVPQSVDDDDVKLKVQLIEAVQNQPMNQFAAAFDNIQPIRDLIIEGYDLKAQILPTIKRHRYKGHGTINGWGYWATVIRNSCSSQVSGKPKPVRYAQEEWEPGELVTNYVN